MHSIPKIFDRDILTATERFHVALPVPMACFGQVYWPAHHGKNELDIGIGIHHGGKVRQLRGEDLDLAAQVIFA